MKPILFPEGQKDFSTNGLGRLPDAIPCKVTEERNGQYQLHMYFVIRNASEVFREIVFEGKEKEFAVFGQWEPMGGHANVYVTYDLGERAILPLKEGDVWTVFPMSRGVRYMKKRELLGHE